jgi:hypothetical protein
LQCNQASARSHIHLVAPFLLLGLTSSSCPSPCAMYAAHCRATCSIGEVASEWTREVQLPVRPDTDRMPGVVSATHGWGNAATRGMRVASESPGTNVNRLLASGPGTYDPFSNMAHMTGVVVEVESAAFNET